MKKGPAILVAMIGSIVGVLGFFLNWIKIFGFETFSGFQLIQLLLSNYFSDFGVSTTLYGIFILLALIALVLAAILCIFVFRDRPARKGEAILLIILGGITVLIAILFKSNLSYFESGPGFYLTILGAIAVIVGGVMAMMAAPDTGPVSLQSLKRDVYQSAQTAKFEIGKTARNVSSNIAQGQNRNWTANQQQWGQNPPPQNWSQQQQSYAQPPQWQAKQPQDWSQQQQQYPQPSQTPDWSQQQSYGQAAQWQSTQQQDWAHQPPIQPSQAQDWTQQPTQSYDQASQGQIPQPNDWSQAQQQPMQPSSWTPPQQQASPPPDLNQSPTDGRWRPLDQPLPPPQRPGETPAWQIRTQNPPSWVTGRQSPSQSSQPTDAQVNPTQPIWTQPDTPGEKIQPEDPQEAS